MKSQIIPITDIYPLKNSDITRFPPIINPFQSQQSHSLSTFEKYKVQQIINSPYKLQGNNPRQLIVKPTRTGTVRIDDLIIREAINMDNTSDQVTLVQNDNESLFMKFQALSQKNLLKVQQTELQARHLFNQNKIAFEENSEDIMKQAMDNNYKNATKMVVNSQTGQFLKEQIPNVMRILEKPFNYKLQEELWFPRKPYEDYSYLINKIADQYDQAYTDRLQNPRIRSPYRARNSRSIVRSPVRSPKRLQILKPTSKLSTRSVSPIRIYSRQRSQSLLTQKMVTIQPSARVIDDYTNVVRNQEQVLRNLSRISQGLQQPQQFTKRVKILPNQKSKQVSNQQKSSYLKVQI